MIGELKDFLDLCKEWLQSLGLEEATIQVIILILVSVIILIVVSISGYKFITWLLFLRKRTYLQRDLHPFFTNLEIDKAVRHYIPTKYQDTPPSQGEEPGRKFIDSPQSTLIPMFLKKAFQMDDNRFYLILADAGMGKTTFMINLYLAYKRQWAWGKPKYNIRLLPLGNSRTLDEISKIKDQENTILLLDALDEDHEAVDDYVERLSEILEKVWRFREVVITCRTQFFPSRAEEPHETGFFKHGTDGGEFYFRKAYVSVFSDRDVFGYLLKKYNLLNPIHWRKIGKALKIIKKSPNLMVRPMLLSHIRDLEESKQDFDYTYQIYEALIEKWIEREAQKPGLRQKYGSKIIFKKKLYILSQKLAVNLYENREKRGGLFININERIPATELQLADFENDYDFKKFSTLKESEWRSRSLLNRDVEGNYKFSHRSILEYFLAKEAIDNPSFSNELKLSGLDAASNFLIDMRFEKEIWEWKKKGTKMSRKEILRTIIYSKGRGMGINYIMWDNLGDVYLEKEDYDKAIECYQKAISIKKDYHYAWNGLGYAYRRKEDYDKAIECHQKAISINKDYPNAWNGLGYAYRRKEDYDKAIECYQKAISINKDYPNAWNGLGNAYWYKEDYDKAIECYQKAISIKKDYHYAWEGLGYAYYRKEEYDRTIECLQKAISIKKDYHYAWNGLGITYGEKEDYDKAIECYQKAISINKDSHNAWNGLGITYGEKEDYDKAIECYQKAISIKKDSHNAWDRLGDAYQEKEDYDKAIECYQKAISIKEDYHHAWNGLGFIYLINNDLQKANESLGKALKHSKGYNKYVHMNIGHLHLINNQVDEAYLHYKNGVALLKTIRQKDYFFKQLDKDYKSLLLEKQNVDKKDYDEIVKQLKSEVEIEVE